MAASSEYGIVVQNSPLLVRFKGVGAGVPVGRNAAVVTYPVDSKVLVLRVNDGDPGVAVCVVS